MAQRKFIVFITNKNFCFSFEDIETRMEDRFNSSSESANVPKRKVEVIEEEELIGDAEDSEMREYFKNIDGFDRILNINSR